MKLSELVDFRHRLQALRPRPSELIARQEFGQALHEIESSAIQFSDLTGEIKGEYAAVIRDIDRFADGLERIISEIDKVIGGLQPGYFAESYRLYYENMRRDSDQLILDRRFGLPAEALDFIAARIRSFGGWHWPCMIIRPGREDWINSLVACDPLYLVDKNYELLQPAIDRYPQEYQRRLRRYVIDEERDDMLRELPQGQFGFVLAYNLLNYKPLEIVKSYFKNVYDCLCAGGVFACTINDGDKTGGVRLAERSFMCYTPASMVLTLAENIGYVPRQVYHIDSSNTWIEIQKPGERASLRGGQALAQIVPKT
jgi:hypothetical protein